MQNELLAAMRNNKDFAKDYLEARSLLWKLHIFEFLRSRSRPRVIDSGRDVQVQATQAVYSAGYSDCLDDLTEFIDRFLKVAANPNGITPDYGGLVLAGLRGDLTQAEIDELKLARTAPGK